MTTDEQNMMDSLSRNVTTLCEAIDPEFKHGPETEKIASHARKTRELAETLAHSTFVGNREHQRNVAREILTHLGIEQPVNGGIAES